MQVHQYFDFHVSRYPENDCLIFQGEVFSYSDINSMSFRIANGLKILGIGANDRVAVISGNCPEFLAIMIGCSRIGAVTVPINYRLAPPEIAFILGDCDAKLLLSPDDSVNPQLAAMSEQAEDSCPRISKQLNAAPNQQSNWDSWLATQSPEPLVHDTYQQKAFIQFYTSGTTGKPKGVVLSHDNINSLFTKSIITLKYKSGPGTRDLVSAPSFHIGGAGTLLLAILAGGCVVLHKNFDPVAVADDLERYGVVFTFLVPAMIQAIMQSVPDIAKRDFSALKQIMYGASPISPPLLATSLEIFNCDFYQAYGMTETCGNIVSLSAEDHRQALHGRSELLEAAGRPQAGVEVKVVNTRGETLPSGETGELVVRSASNMMGYYNRPDATAETLVDGWLKTGDSAVIDSDGYIYLRDRIKDMIVSGGENIYPIEVENAISQHPSVAEVAVIGIPDEKYGETPLACIVLRSGKSLTLDELIDWCRELVAGYKIPRQLKIMEALPRNPSGKVLKKELRADYWEGKGRAIN